MGRDKAFIEIDGVPLWQRQLRILERLAPAEIFLAASPRPEWNDGDYAIIADAQANCGPLGGLVTALQRSSTTHLLALAVDVPNITRHYLQSLLELCSHGKGVVPVTDRYEPLVAVYQKHSLRIAEQFLADGYYSLQEFVSRCVAEDLLLEHRVAPADAALFQNVNTPADLAVIAP